MTVDRIPLRTVPSFAARLADARACGHTPDQHRHTDGHDADQRDAQRTIRELTAELERTRRANARLAAERADLNRAFGTQAAALTRARAELGRALDALATIRDAHEQTDRALAAYDTTGQEG